MSKLLLVNACINRKTSRTLRLAKEVVKKFPDYKVEELALEDLGLCPLTSSQINRRSELVASNDFSDPIFEYAKKLASSDVIVIASPFWENCFNSYTKVFLEYSAAIGIVFKYSDEGREIGLCRAKCLYYVTTRGGYVSDEEDLGYKVIESLARTYGISRSVIVSANGLDVYGNNAEELMEEAISAIPSKL